MSFYLYSEIYLKGGLIKMTKLSVKEGQNYYNKPSEHYKELTRFINSMPDDELKKYIDSLLDNYKGNDVIKDLVNEEYILQDIMKASKGKRQTPYVKNIIGDEFDDIFENENNKILKLIRNIQITILTDSFHPVEHEPVIVYDKSNRKERKIIKPDFAEEQIIHHAVMRMIMPQLKKGMYAYTCASIPGRGIHYARRHVENAIRRDPKNCKYILKMDIRKFFESIPHRLLKKRIRDIVKDKTLRTLLFRTIDITEKGLPLGFYTSQWLANFYLQPLDHYIKERILDDCCCNTERTGRHGAVHYFRYMDDMVIMGPNKKELHLMKRRLDDVLAEEFGLRIKYDWQVFRLDYIDRDGKRKGRPLDFVGFQFYHDKVKIRKRTYKRIKKLIFKLRKQNIKEISFHDAASILSYYGFIYWSDTQELYTKLLRPYVKLKDLKNIIKNEYKRRLDCSKKVS